MTQRENMLRVIRFERPEFIPVNFCVSVPGDDCETDFFGNAIVSRNIGCYGGTGTDAPFKGETVFARLLRFFRTLFAMLKNLFEGKK